MDKNILLINGLILFYIAQRLSEVFISAGNEVWLKKNCNAVEVSPKESLRMKVFHTTWFLCLIIEANISAQFQPNALSIIIYIILATCLAIRIHTIEKLKRFWTIKIFSMKNQVIATDGLYRFIRHPNYLVVMIELFFIPLLLKAYVTMIIFSVFNVFILTKRIKLEEDTLMMQSDYRSLFAGKNKFLPFFAIVFFLINPSIYASEIEYHYKNYDDAKKSEIFVKFESTSTKLGFITTAFDGYAKDIKIIYNLTNDQLTNIETIIPVKSLDTDSSARNEKMFHEIMEAEKYPSIKIVIPKAITLTEGKHSTEMIFTIKEKSITKITNFLVAKKNGTFVITGDTSLGLKEVGLPDPSIAIAKVKDLFDLKFSIILSN